MGEWCIYRTRNYDQNYLGSDGYFSFPITTIKYSPDGSIARYALDGSLVEQVSPPHAGLSADLAASKIQNVSPVFPRPASYSFVPHLTLSQLDSITNVGYSISNQYPEYLEITGQGQKIIFDNNSKTCSFLLYDQQSKLASIQTDYYVADNNMVYKTRSLTQQYVTLVSGLCVIKAKEIVYTSCNLSIGENNSNFLKQKEKVTTDSDSPISIFPNPTTSSFTLSINDNKYQPRNVKLFDINGQIVPFISSTDILGNLTIIPQFNSPAMLMLSYELNNKNYTQKVLKF